MEKIRKGFNKFFNKFIRKILSIPDSKARVNSVYALMPNGPMKNGSIGLMILSRLIQAYHAEYEHNVDKEDILSAMTANYHVEAEAAWQAFLAEIGEGDE